jgi:FtsH-binding integral membrane protein
MVVVSVPRNDKDKNQMNTYLIAALLVLFCLSCVGGMISMYLVGYKKWWVWLFGIVGFISGFFVGLLATDITGGLTLGVLFAFIIISGGVVTRLYRSQFKDK